MHRISALLLGMCLTALLATSPAFAKTSAHVSRASYSDSALSFTYPNGWKKLSQKQAKAIGGPFAKVGHGLTLSDVAGVTGHTSKAAGIVVAVKVAFNKKFQGQIKGHNSVFINGVIKGIAKNSGVKVIRKGQGTLSGQPAKTVEVTASGANPSHQKFWVAVAGDDKSMYMVLALTVPESAWNSYNSNFSNIEGSTHYR